MYADSIKKFTIRTVIFVDHSASKSESMEVSSNIVSKKGLIEASKKEDWGRLWVILVAHTIKRLVYRYGIKEKKELLVDRSNKLISDVLSLALIEGKRNWNKDKYSSFKDFIISVLDSHINNKFKKSESKEISTDAVPENSLDTMGPEDEIAYRELKNEAFEFLQNDGATDDEMMVFDCMADGIVKPKAIREELGINEENFHNIWRRLKTRMKKLRKKLGSHE